MSDLRVEQGRMQAANPVFQLIQKLRSLPGIDVKCGQFPPSRNFNQTTAEDDSIFMDEAPPQIRQIGCVAGFVARHAKRLEFFVGKWRRGEGHREPRLRSLGELSQFERLRVRGKDHAIRANTIASDVEQQRFRKFDAFDGRAFIYKDASLGRRHSQAAHHLARIKRSTGNFFSHTQISSVGPANRRLGIFGGAVEFVDPGQVETAGNAQIIEDVRDSTQNVAEARQIAGRGFGKREPACVATRTRAKLFRLEERHRFRRVETLRVGCGGQAAKTSPDHRDIDASRKRLLLWGEIYGPGRWSPAQRVGISGQRSAFQNVFVQFTNDAGHQPPGMTPVSAGSLASIRIHSIHSRLFDAPLETLGPCIRDFSLYPLDLILRGHPTPPVLATRPLYFPGGPITVEQQHGCIYQTFLIPAHAGGMRWLYDQHR